MTTSPFECKLASHSTARHNTVVARATHLFDRKHRYVFIGSLLSWGILLAFAYIWGPSIVRLMKSSGEALRVTLELNFKKTVYLFRGDYFILTAGARLLCFSLGRFAKIATQLCVAIFDTLKDTESNDEMKCVNADDVKVVVDGNSAADAVVKKAIAEASDNIAK
ncbi:hypothetical protein MRX96_027852 [Rhipicephalus microplus]